jgi:hypothetical protein
VGSCCHPKSTHGQPNSYPCDLIVAQLLWQYHGVWHCIVGRNFGSYVTNEAKHYIYFYQGQIAVCLFKTN